MAFVGESFNHVDVKVYTTDRRDVVHIGGYTFDFEAAEKLAGFISSQIHEVKRDRGDYEW